MKKLIFVSLGLLLAACSLGPARQLVENVVQEPGEATIAIEPTQPLHTATHSPVPTEPAVLPTPTAVPTHSPVPLTPTLPATYTPESSTPTPVVYVVQAGDTLAAVAARFQVSIEAIAAENDIVDVNQIAVGQVLTIPTGAVVPQRTKPPEATATDTPVLAHPVTPDESAPEAEKNWPGICHPALEDEGARVADLNMGETVELAGYLYVKFTTIVRDEKIVFTFGPAPYEGYELDRWVDRCTIHAWIPRDEGGKPNHVKEYGRTLSSVVILDAGGREIRGWNALRDSVHVRLKGTVVEPYGGATGLGGSNTIDVVEIELLASP